MENKKSFIFAGLMSFFILVSLLPVFGGQTYTMKGGDTLWDLSNKFYGDPTLYPIFLEVNKIDNVRTIPTGKVLVIPSAEDIKKISREHDPDKRKALISQAAGSSDSRPLIEKNDSSSSNSSYDQVGLRRDSFLNVLAGPKPGTLQKVDGSKK